MLLSVSLRTVCYDLCVCVCANDVFNVVVVLFRILCWFMYICVADFVCDVCLLLLCVVCFCLSSFI